MEPNQTVDVDRLRAEPGSTIELRDVLLVSGDGGVRVGAPLVQHARVIAEVVEHLRGDKIRIFKYKNKTRYRRRMGHRQDFTRLTIREILTSPPEEAKPAAKPRRASRGKAAAGPQASAEAEAPVETEAPAVEAAAAGGAPAPDTAPKATRRPRAKKTPPAEAGPEAGDAGE